MPMAKIIYKNIERGERNFRKNSQIKMRKIREEYFRFKKRSYIGGFNFNCGADKQFCGSYRIADKDNLL